MDYNSRVLKDFNCEIDESNSHDTLQTHARMKSAATSDAKTEQQMASDIKENVQTDVVCDINAKGNKSLSLNDILCGPKSGHIRVENECGDNIYTNVDQNNCLKRVTNLDRGDQILPEMNLLSTPLHQPTIAQEAQSTENTSSSLKFVDTPVCDSVNSVNLGNVGGKPISKELSQIAEQVISATVEIVNPVLEPIVPQEKEIVSTVSTDVLTPCSQIYEHELKDAQKRDLTTFLPINGPLQDKSETIQPLAHASTNQCDDFIQLGPEINVVNTNIDYFIKDQIQQAGHGIEEIITNIIDTEVRTPSITELKSNSNNAPQKDDAIQHVTQTNHELPPVCQETNVDMLNKIDAVKKNLLTMFDTFDTIQPKAVEESITKIKSTVNKLEVQNINSKSSNEPNLVPTVHPIHEIKDEANVVPDPPLVEFQKLNSEIESNNDKINSTLEAVIINQILDQQHGSDTMPSLVEQINDSQSLVQNGNALENMILNQILEQNNFRSMIDEIPDSKRVTTQSSTDFQISDIDVTSADNFIEFVDEIIDFALRKVDFLKTKEPEIVQPLTPVPEEPDETSEAVTLNHYYANCLFTPTVEPQNINFPTLESFEIDELQAKVMEQADALYLNETPINENLPPLLGAPESPKINELHAKAMEQAHELNLNETIAEFMYLHTTDNSVPKPVAEPVEMNVNVEIQRKLPPPIAIAAVIENSIIQPTHTLNNFPDTIIPNESFFLGEPPTMCRSQSNRPQSPMDTSQTKLSQSMNEVYFDKRLDITGKRSFRRERDQKLTPKSKKDYFNESLNREKSREKSEEPQNMLSKDTPRDSLEDLSEIKTDSRDNKHDESMLHDSHIEKQEREESGVDRNDDSKDNKTERKESLKDSLENLVEAVEQTEYDDNKTSNTKRKDEEVEKLMRDSLENLVEADEVISESVKQVEVANEQEKQNSINNLPVQNNSQKDKKCNCSATKSNDITAVNDEIQRKGVQSDVKSSSEENVIHNKITAPNSIVQSVKNVASVVVSKILHNDEEHKNGTMSLDIRNGGDKLDSNKYYESVSDEPKIKTEFIMAEYRKPVGSSNGDLDKIINEYESKEESLIRRLTDKEKIITKMTGVMEAYEKTIAEMIAEKEQLIQEYEQKCVNLKSDADLNAQHLLSLEDTFADLHAKYERSKQITIGLKTNEEELCKGNLQNLELLNAQEIRYEKMKSHAIGQLQIANDKLEILQRAHAQESTKLKATLKREELARSSLNEQLQQKIRENEELVKICEELIGKE